MLTFKTALAVILFLSGFGLTLLSALYRGAFWLEVRDDLGPAHRWKQLLYNMVTGTLALLCFLWAWKLTR